MYIDRHHVASNCLGRIDQILEKNAGIRKQEDINRLNRVMNVLYDVNIFMENVCSAMTDIIRIDPGVVCKAVGANSGSYEFEAKKAIEQGKEKIEKYIDSPIYEEIALHDKEVDGLRKKIQEEKTEREMNENQIFMARMTRDGGLNTEQAEVLLNNIRNTNITGLRNPTAEFLFSHAPSGPSCLA